jgi:hypothetical protein
MSLQHRILLKITQEYAGAKIVVASPRTSK